jgi:hypothetical protein
MTDIFIREDLSRPENRINVALFGLLTVPEFAGWFRDKLQLPTDTVIYPPRNTANDAGAGRPDFEAKLADTSKVIAQIEVEITRNIEQLQRFRRMFPTQRVLAIWGRPSSECDLSLEEIEAFLRTAAQWKSPQARVNAEHLRLLIHDALEGARASPGRAAVGDEMWESPLMVGLRTAIGSRLVRLGGGKARLGLGEVGVNTTDTTDNKGFSVRVASRVANDGSVSVLNRKAGAPAIGFSTKAWLRHYLPERHGAIDQLVHLVASLGGDLVQDWTPALDGNKPRAGTVTVPLGKVEPEVATLAKVLVQLAGGN